MGEQAGRSEPGRVTTGGLVVRSVRRGEAAEALADFLCADAWPFHAGGRPTRAQVLDRVASGYYDDEATETFLFSDGRDVVASLRLTDLLDDTAMADVRVAGPRRSRGVGTDVLRWATGHAFATREQVHRIEATTRHDNLAMRRVLRRCGYVKESHYRASWPDGEGRLLDAVGYAILRGDWRTGTTTEVRWEDEE